MSVRDSIKNALKVCLRIKSSESVGVVYDEKTKDLAQLFFDEVKTITEDAEMIEVEVGKEHGAEPSPEVASKMLNFDVLLLITTKSLSHTEARRKCNEKGLRIASMPGITEDIVERTLGADYEKIREFTLKICAILEKGKKARVVTKSGTDIEMDITDRPVWGHSGGILDKQGEMENLPAGEACLAPIEGSTNGVFIVDASMAGVGKLVDDIKITVEDGLVVKIEGKREAQMLNKLLKSYDDDRVYNIAEFGIGTNDQAKITGNILEDEKVRGTCHIALGNNLSLGGDVDVPLHLDGIMLMPTIYIDDRLIMKDGEFVEDI